jgi:endoglucanase
MEPIWSYDSNDSNYHSDMCIQTYNSQWNWDANNLIITAAAVSVVQALGEDVIFTFEFYPRIPGNSVNYTLTV